MEPNIETAHLLSSPSPQLLLPLPQGAGRSRLRPTPTTALLTFFAPTQAYAVPSTRTLSGHRVPMVNRRSYYEGTRDPACITTIT